MDEPIWGPIDNVQDAYSVEFQTYVSYAAWRIVPRTWKERLFSWPWRPWRAVKGIIVPLGSRSTE